MLNIAKEPGIYSGVSRVSLDAWYGPWLNDGDFLDHVLINTNYTLVDSTTSPSKSYIPKGFKYSVLLSGEVIEKKVISDITDNDYTLNLSTYEATPNSSFDEKVKVVAQFDSDYLKESDLSDLYYTYNPEDTDTGNNRYTSLANAVDAHKIIKVGKYIALVKDTYHQDYGGYVEYEISYLDEDKNLHVITDNRSVNYGSPILFVSLPVEYNTTTLNYVPSYGTSGQVLSTNGTDGVAWTTITPGITATSISRTWYTDTNLDTITGYTD